MNDYVNWQAVSVLYVCLNNFTHIALPLMVHVWYCLYLMAMTGSNNINHGMFTLVYRNEYADVALG